MIFSPILEIRLTKLSFTVRLFAILELFILSKFPLHEKFNSDNSLQNFIKSSFFATKSVSLLTSIIDIIPLSSFTNANPSEAVLLIFFEALAIPFFLKNSIDLSISPLFSSKANLQSLKPTPVNSLNFLILSNRSLFDIKII